MQIDLTFKNASPKLREIFKIQNSWYLGVKASSVKEAEKLITQGLQYAQAVGITVWLKNGYIQGHTDRKHWNGNLYEAVPELT